MPHLSRRNTGPIQGQEEDAVTTLTELKPVQGVSYDKSRPETRQPWLDQRRGGITATEIRDWGFAAKRREIITAKVTGIDDDASRFKPVGNTGFTLDTYAQHGNRREPIIAAWVEGRFGITSCDHVYSHAENPRHLASPDGVTLDPFSKELVVGPEAALCEIKTSTKDLNPGRIVNHLLVEMAPGSTFEQKNYYTQMQWQMYVMNAARTLFVWEVHDGKINEETGTFTPVGPPQWCWIQRDEKLIDLLVNKIAPAALAEIDAAIETSTTGDLPPASDLPSEHAMLVANLLKARTAEAVAKAAKEQAWKALQDHYLANGSPDLTIDAGFAQVTVSTTRGTRQVVDEDGMRAKAPAVVAKYEALRERYTRIEETESRKLTVTEKKDGTK